VTCEYTDWLQSQFVRSAPSPEVLKKRIAEVFRRRELKKSGAAEPSSDGAPVTFPLHLSISLSLSLYLFLCSGALKGVQSVEPERHVPEVTEAKTAIVLNSSMAETTVIHVRAPFHSDLARRRT
jgi:hypothetical protein